jgi:glyoxylase-like metal-dependent hydrolase (beta-lactamase superfamily II)
MRRRPSLTAIVAFSLSLSGFGAGGRGQVYNYLENPNKPRLEIVKLGGGLYMAKGGWGSNVGFWIANNEVLVIHSKGTKGATRKVVEEIGKITKDPITRVVFTHSDPDSFNGREAYPGSAAVICTPGVYDDFWNDATVYLEMNAPADVYDWPKVDFIPAMTFEGQLNIRIGRDEVTLLHYGPAHTSGDSILSGVVSAIPSLTFNPPYL